MDESCLEFRSISGLGKFNYASPETGSKFSTFRSFQVRFMLFRALGEYCAIVHDEFLIAQLRRKIPTHVELPKRILVFRRARKTFCRLLNLRIYLRDIIAWIIKLSA